MYCSQPPQCWYSLGKLFPGPPRAHWQRAQDRAVLAPANSHKSGGGQLHRAVNTCLFAPSSAPHWVKLCPWVLTEWLMPPEVCILKLSESLKPSLKWSHNNLSIRQWTEIIQLPCRTAKQQLPSCQCLWLWLTAQFKVKEEYSSRHIWLPLTSAKHSARYFN